MYSLQDFGTFVLSFSDSSNLSAGDSHLGQNTEKEWMNFKYYLFTLKISQEKKPCSPKYYSLIALVIVAVYYVKMCWYFFVITMKIKKINHAYTLA